MATSIHIHFWTTLGERIYGLSEGALVSGIATTRAGLIKSLQWPLAFSIKGQGQSEGLQVIYITETREHESDHMMAI